MELSLETDSWIVTTLFLITLTTFPVKLAALIVGAERTSIKSAALAVALGTVSFISCIEFIGSDLIGIIAALTTVLLAYKLVLSTSVAQAIGIAILTIIFQASLIQGAGSALFHGAQI